MRVEEWREKWLQAPQSLVSPQGRAGGLPGASPRRGARISGEEAGRPLPKKRRCSLTVGTPEAPPDLGPRGSVLQENMLPQPQDILTEDLSGDLSKPSHKTPNSRCS